MLNLNLGSGSKRIEGFVNLDKFDTFNPDIFHDLECLETLQEKCWTQDI